MVLSVSGVVLFGAVLYFLYRNGRTTLLTAVVAILFGFMLASTGVAPAIHSLLDDGAHAASSVRP
ncbi:hypothetical protein ACIQOV_41940 [Kitasatospora sp. NPDC091257]|uniref:hypothetical protein n=1 Tax=Kitasatospora sp. NPDC091257 TaxID=3364084 RepID=UPI003810FF3A